MLCAFNQGNFDQLANVLLPACSGVKSPMTAILNRYKSQSVDDQVKGQLAAVTVECSGQKHQVLQAGIVIVQIFFQALVS